MSSVVYAKDIVRVAAFYERTLSLSRLDANAGFILLGDDAIEIAVVRVPEAIAQDIHLTVPPHVREETPLKLSFFVRDIAHVRAEAEANGGGTQPLDRGWHWRGQLHLDGHDPEGNVVQFRTVSTERSAS